MPSGARLSPPPSTPPGASAPSLCPDLVPCVISLPPDHPQRQVPRHPGCPNPGEAADSKRAGRGGEAFGSDDGGGATEIHSEAGGARQEEEGGKNPVKRGFGISLPGLSADLWVQVALQRGERNGHHRHLLLSQSLTKRFPERQRSSKLIPKIITGASQSGPCSASFPSFPRRPLPQQAWACHSCVPVLPPALKPPLLPLSLGKCFLFFQRVAWPSPPPHPNPSHFAGQARGSVSCLPTPWYAPAHCCLPCGSLARVRLRAP